MPGSNIQYTTVYWLFSPPPISIVCFYTERCLLLPGATTTRGKILSAELLWIPMHGNVKIQEWSNWVKQNIYIRNNYDFREHMQSSVLLCESWKMLLLLPTSYNISYLIDIKQWHFTLFCPRTNTQDQAGIYFKVFNC